jgi:hypothetical protein
MDLSDLKKTLIEHFSYLAQNASDVKLLERIIEKAKRAIVKDDTLLVYFNEEDEPLEATSPMTHIPDHFPESYKVCLRKHQTVSLNGSTLGQNDASNIDGYKEELEELGEMGKEFARSKELVCPFNTDGAYYFIYHPFKKRKDGSPQLYFVIPHDSPEISPMKDEEDVRTSFLLVIAHQLGLSLDDNATE